VKQQPIDFARSLVEGDNRARGGAWGATHVLAFEREEKMIEVLVRREGASLFTAEEWTGHAVADWTFEEDGRLYLCGEDYVETVGRCTLRPLGQKRLRLDAVLRAVRLGCEDPFEISRILERSVEEIETSLSTLVRLGQIVVGEDGAVRLASGG